MRHVERIPGVRKIRRAFAGNGKPDDKPESPGKSGSSGNSGKGKN